MMNSKCMGLLTLLWLEKVKIIAEIKAVRDILFCPRLWHNSKESDFCKLVTELSQSVVDICQMTAM